MIIFDLFEDQNQLSELAPPEDHNWNDDDLDDDPVGRAAYRAAMTIKAWRMDKITAINTLASYPQLTQQLQVLEPAILTNKKELKELLDWAVSHSRISDEAMMDLSESVAETAPLSRDSRRERVAPTDRDTVRRELWKYVRSLDQEGSSNRAHAMAHSCPTWGRLYRQFNDDVSQLLSKAPTEQLAQALREIQSKFQDVAEATGNSKFDAMMSKISNDPWTQLNSNPNWEEEIEDLVSEHIEPWLWAMEKANIPITKDDETLNPGWRKRYEEVSTQLARKYLASKKFNPRDPDLVNKIRAKIDWHTDESDSVHGQLSAYADNLPLQLYRDNPAADEKIADLRAAMFPNTQDEVDDDGYATRPRPEADPRRLDPGNLEEGLLNEFDPGEHGMPPFTVYVGDTLIDKFASYDEAQEEVKYQRGLDPRWAHDQWKIVNGIGETVWEYDVGEKFDDMKRQHKIQFIPRDNKGVAEGSEHEGLVLQFLKSITPKELRYYSIRDNCGPAALHMMDWAKEKGIELHRVNGYFVADNVVYDKADFTKEMKHEFLQQGLDFNDPKSRQEFIASNPKYSKEWKKVPHYWLQDDRGTVYDPTGYIQFIKTGLAKDLDKSRYETVQGVAEGQYEIHHLDPEGRRKAIYHHGKGYTDDVVRKDTQYHQERNPRDTFQVFKDKQPFDWQGVAEGSLEEVDRRGFLKGLGAAAGLAAMGGAKAATSPDDDSWYKIGQPYDSSITANRTVTQTDNQPSKLTDRISDVKGPNSKGEYLVTVIHDDDIVSHYVTKTPPASWMKGKHKAYPQVASVKPGVAESAGAGEYYIWTVHFANPEKNPPRRIRVYSDEFVEELEHIKKFYAKKGLTVVDVDTDTGLARESVAEGYQSFYNGDRVQLTRDYADPRNPNEVFTVSQCDRERGRCWIGDEQGRGWSATFDQLIPVEDDEVDEDSTNFKAYRVPELNRSLPGISTAAQKTSQVMNLKQNQPYVRRLIPSPTGHLQVSVDAKMIGQQDGGAIIRGNTIDTSGRRAYAKPWSVHIDSEGNIIAQDLSRLNDDELAAVEYNLVTRNRLLQPNQIAQAVAEARVLAEKQTNKKHKDAIQDPILSYQGINHRVKGVLKRAYAENPGAKNDIEAIVGHIASVDDTNQDQQRQISMLTKKLIQAQDNYNQQEQRFQELTNRLRKQGGQPTPQDVQAAQAAGQIEQPVAVVAENTPKMSARERLQRTVDREKKQAQLDRTGLSGLDYDDLQRQLRGIQDRTRPKKVSEVSGYLAQEPQPLNYAQRIRRLVAQYQGKPAVLGTLAREKGADSDEQIAFDYIRTGKLRPEPGEQSVNVNWNDVVRGISTQPTLGGQDLLNAAAAELKKIGYGTTPETRDLLNSVLNGSPDMHRQLQSAYDRKIAKSRELAEDSDNSAVEQAIARRIMVGHTDLLLKYGPRRVMQAVEEVAYDTGDIDEIGSSDVSGWVRQVERALAGMSEAANPAQQAAIAINMKRHHKKPKQTDEATATSTRLDPKCWTGKKIGNPKTKVKNGVRVNNCVPK